MPEIVGQMLPPLPADVHIFALPTPWMWMEREQRVERKRKCEGEVSDIPAQQAFLLALSYITASLHCFTQQSMRTFSSPYQYLQFDVMVK